MKIQKLWKPSNWWLLALMFASTALAGVTVLYGISQLQQTGKPSKPVQSVPSIRKVTALGRLEPATEVAKISVPANLSNDCVAQLLVQRGDFVTAGQVIAILDARERLQSALLEAQTQVRVSRAELAKVKAGAKSGEIAAQAAEIARLQKELKGGIAIQQATIARWQAEFRTANADYNRYFALYGEGATAKQQLDQKQLASESALAQLEQARAEQNKSIDTLQEQIGEAKATLNKIAEVRSVDVEAAQAEVDKAIAAAKKAEAELAEAYIRAPRAGRIFDTYAKPGEVVGDKGIVDLGQTSQMQAVAEVYQTDIGKIREGQQATITSDLFPGQLRGTVRLMGLQVIQQKVTSGKPGENLDRKVIEVRIGLNPKDSQRVANLTNLQVQVAIQQNMPSGSSQ